MTDGFTKLTDLEKLQGRLRDLRALDRTKMSDDKRKSVEGEEEALERNIEHFNEIDGQRPWKLRAWIREGRFPNNSRRLCQRQEPPQEDE